MKKTVSRLLIALMLCVMTGAVVFGKEKSRVITFGQDIIVGEKVVKAGTYKLVFDDQTNELTFADKKTKEVVAKVKTTVQANGKKTDVFDIKWTMKDGKNALVSITFAGDDKALVVSEGL